MTRTFVAGKPSTKQQIIYDIVKDSQESAFKIIREGTLIAAVDIAARQVIEAAGFGYDFVHRLGHGVGLEVHEPPSLNQQTKDALVAGNVISIEPGIYLPGFGGVRIEDTVLVQKNCAEKLTHDHTVSHLNNLFPATQLIILHLVLTLSFLPLRKQYN
jgi:Xaa-Pro dipeptidase